MASHLNFSAVRKQGNLLLCTLLLGNTVINSAISILLADLTTGTIGLLVSTFLILIFGRPSHAGARIANISIFLSLKNAR